MRRDDSSYNVYVENVDRRPYWFPCKGLKKKHCTGKGEWVQGEGEEVWGAVQRERPPNTAFALFVLARVVVTKTLPKDWKGQSGGCKKPRL